MRQEEETVQTRIFNVKVEIKMPLGLINWALGHEEEWGPWWHSTTLLDLRTR
jgi:hypothetical protein